VKLRHVGLRRPGCRTGVPPVRRVFTVRFARPVRGGYPVAPIGHPPATALRDLTISGSRCHIPVAPPVADDLGVGLVEPPAACRAGGSSSLVARAVRPTGAGSTGAVVAHRGLGITRATSPGSSAARTGAGSLNWAIRPGRLRPWTGRAPARRLCPLEVHHGPPRSGLVSAPEPSSITRGRGRPSRHRIALGFCLVADSVTWRTARLDSGGRVPRPPSPLLSRHQKLGWTAPPARDLRADDGRVRVAADIPFRRRLNRGNANPRCR